MRIGSVAVCSISRYHCIWTSISLHPHTFQLITYCLPLHRKSVPFCRPPQLLSLTPSRSLSLSVSLPPLPALFLTLVIFIPFSSPDTKQPILDAHWGILPQVGMTGRFTAWHCLRLWSPAVWRQLALICPITIRTEWALITKCHYMSAWSIAQTTFSHCK